MLGSCYPQKCIVDQDARASRQCRAGHEVFSVAFAVASGIGQAVVEVVSSAWVQRAEPGVPRIRAPGFSRSSVCSHEETRTSTGTPNYRKVS
jgi:hypothetical protein